MKTATLQAAISNHVEPGLHLHFASTPSRSNASIVALAARFGGQKPNFTFSATGFHSLAHLLGLTRMGERYISCFYGDNFPTPRPNPLYQQLLDEGVALEHYSLLSYVSALRASAFGQAGAVSRQLSGTSLGKQLRQSGRYREYGEGQGTRGFGLLEPLTPDVSFVHAAVGDDRGHAWFTPPHSEGFHGSLAARRGVIITVDELRNDDSVRARPELIPIPANRVLAICEAPFGAHPQPLHFADPHSNESYRDDFEHYRLWRRMTHDPQLFEEFRRRVLSAEDSWAAYLDFVGSRNLFALRSRSLRSSATTPPPSFASARSEPSRESAPLPLSPSETVVVLAARALCDRVRSQNLNSLLAGIGLSFRATRLCKLLLGPEANDVELMVETGFSGFAQCEAPDADDYLLSQENIAAAQRLTNVESVLGTLVCGGTNRCMGVIGAAQVDVEGNVNSTFVDGMLLVGSGGACDIALGAREVTVLTRFDRLVSQVEYITSPGTAVRQIVTERGVLHRTGDRWLFELCGADPGRADLPLPWNNIVTIPAKAQLKLTPVEREFVQRMRLGVVRGISPSESGTRPTLPRSLLDEAPKNDIVNEGGRR